jgi:ATP phosphoribosyltransferase
LEKETFKLLSQAGYQIKGWDKSYTLIIDDPEIELKILRPQEIPTLLAEGSHDLGITGLAWIEEVGAKCVFLTNLEYGSVKIVLAIPEQWNQINSLDQLIRSKAKDDSELRIATEYLNLSSSLLSENPTYQEIHGNKPPTVITPWWTQKGNPKVKIILSFGATEAKPPRDADAIIDNTETGVTLQKNNLKIIHTIMNSTAWLIASPNTLNKLEKMEKVFDVLTLVQGVVEARKKLHIFANVEKKKLPKLLKMLPALKSPTVSPLSKTGWVSVNTVIERKQFIQLIPTLRKQAQGIVVHEPKQIIPHIDFKKVLKDANNQLRGVKE